MTMFLRHKGSVRSYVLGKATVCHFPFVVVSSQTKV